MLSAPRAVYVRGRGVDAELGGQVRFRGTLDAPELSGGFDLLRGEYELVGQTLRFDRGRLGFDGAAGLDPTLDLEARATAAGSTAILNLLGTATAPRIELRGEPELPEDEVLSRLLFGVAGGRLSGLQAARLGMAAASLAGLETGKGLAVLDQARTGLGLDRLSIGTDQQGDAVLEGGRYLSERVYLGARQGARAGETQGVLRIEVSPRVKLEADVGATGGTRGGGAFEHEY
jgi:translocation and assembly module TamB